MSLPSKEETCKHAVDVLEDVLRNADLYTVAQGMPYEPHFFSTTTLPPLEEALVMHSRLVRDQATMLIGQLMSGCSDDCTFSDLPHILDFPLFVRKSRLLHERMRRVGVTFKSLKHVGLLSEGSTGRRVIMDRAFMSVKELLDAIVAVAVTVAATPLTLSCSYQDTTQKHMAVTPQETFSRSKAPSMGHSRSVMDACCTEKRNGVRPLPFTSPRQLQRRPLKELSTAAGPPLTGKREQEGPNEMEEVEVEKTSGGRNRLENKTRILDGQQEIVSSLLTQEGALPSSLLYSDINALSAEHDSSGGVEEREDSLATIAAAHRISLEELCFLNPHLFDFKYKSLPPNTPVRIPCRKENHDNPVSTRVTEQRRLFQGKLWRELLRDGDTAVSNWREEFISEIGLLFGIPNEWVSDVCRADDSVGALNGGDQEVVFNVRLPLSLEETEVQRRIQQHEFTRLIVLYEEYQERKEREEEQKEEKIKNECNSFGLPKDPSTDSTTALNSGQILFQYGAVEGNSDNYNTDSINTNENSLSMEDIFLALTDVETRARETLLVQEKYGRKFVVKTVLEGWQMVERKQQETVGFSEDSLHYYPCVNKPEVHCEVGETVKKVDVANSLEAPSLPPLPPRSLPVPLSQIVPMSPPEEGEKEQLLPLSSVVFSESSKDETGELEQGDGKSVGLGGVSLQNHAPGVLVEKSVGSPQKMKKLAVQWLCTTHKKVLLGEGWNVVLEQKGEELRRVFTSEAAALFELPEDHVRHLEFTLGSLEATFELLHDRYLQEKEINALLAVFDFPLVRSVYTSCVGSNTTGELRWGNNSTVTGVDEKCLNTSDVRIHLFPPSGATNISFSYGEREGENSPTVMPDEGQEYYKRQLCSRGLSVTLVRDDTATPDNEPLTFAHLALVHDLSIDALVKANPHLSMFSAYDILPPTAHVVIPRSTLDDDISCFIEGNGELNSGRATPSALSSSLSRLHTPCEGDSFRPNSVMNVRNLARKLGVSVNTLRQRNTHLHGYGDADPLPKNCLISVPAQFLVNPESLSLVSSVPSSSHSHSPAKSVTHREQPFKTVLCTTSSRDKRPTLTPFKAVLREQLGLKCLDDKENEAAEVTTTTTTTTASGTKMREFVQRPLDLLSSNQDETVQSFVQFSANDFYTSGVANVHVTRSCSASTNTAVRRDQAVLLMVRSIEQFFLLRFFTKWQFVARMRKKKEMPVDGNQQIAPVRRDLSRNRFQTVNSCRARSQRCVTSPRTHTTRGRGPEVIDRKIDITTRNPSRSVSRQTEPKEGASRALLRGRSQETLHRGSARTRTQSAKRQLKRSDSEHIHCSSFKLSQSEYRLSSQPSSSHGGTPRLSFSRASSTLSGANSWSLDQRVRLGNNLSTPDQFLLGLRISPSLIVIEAYGEAAKAGIRRGDQLEEVEGGRVTTLKGFRRALNCVTASHVTLTVLKKSSGFRTTLCVQRGTDSGEREKSSSTSSSPTEPKITPILSAAKRAVLDTRTVYGCGSVAPKEQSRWCSVSTKLSRGPQRSYGVQTRPRAQ